MKLFLDTLGKMVKRLKYTPTNKYLYYLNTEISKTALCVQGGVAAQVSTGDVSKYYNCHK